MKILVTGANGMLGQDLCPILEDEDYNVVETDMQELDITDPSQAKSVIELEKPDVIIHCAAYTDVDGAEDDLMMATRLNVKGTEIIAKCAEKVGAVMIYISTDYVFDGTDTNIPNPINNYGLTKYKGEKAVEKYCSKHYIIRTSWLYGHHGKNFVETMLKLSNEQNAEIKVVEDQIGCPTWTMELANGIVDLLDEEPEYGIYNICGSGETSWYEFAKEIFKQSKLEVNLVPCKTEDFPCKAKRPKRSVLDNQNICRNWKTALKDYLELRFEE